MTAPIVSLPLEEPSSTAELCEPSLVTPPSDQPTSTVEPDEPSQAMPSTEAPPKSHAVGLRQSSSVSKQPAWMKDYQHK